MDLSDAILTDHARQRMAARGISEDALRRVLAGPDAIIAQREGRVVVQAMLADNHLLRVFVDVDRQPPEVVTAYRTSQVGKYRSES